MNGVNKVSILGRLGADVECRATNSGSTVASVRVATSERWRDKATGETQERTEWHRLKLFGRQAEIARDYLAKGSVAYFEGSLRTDRYTDKDGIERYTTYIHVHDLQLIGGSGSQGSGQSAAPARNTTASRPARSAATTARTPVAAGADDGGFDDIPFFAQRNAIA